MIFKFLQYFCQLTENSVENIQPLTNQGRDIYKAVNKGYKVCRGIQNWIYYDLLALSNKLNSPSLVYYLTFQPPNEQDYCPLGPPATLPRVACDPLATSCRATADPEWSSNCYWQLTHKDLATTRTWHPANIEWASKRKKISQIDDGQKEKKKEILRTLKITRKNNVHFLFEIVSCTNRINATKCKIHTRLSLGLSTSKFHKISLIH